MAGTSIPNRMRPADSASLASNELTASSISGPSMGYGGATNNSQDSGDETTVSGVTLPTALEEEKPKPSPPPPPPQRSDSFSRRSQTRRTSSRTSNARRESAANNSTEGGSREFSMQGSVQRSGSFSRRSQSRREPSQRSQRSSLQRAGSNISNRSRRRIDDDVSSSSSSAWESDMEKQQKPESQRSANSKASESASTIFESVASSDDSSEMEEASEGSYEEESSEDEDDEDELDEDDEMDDEMDDDENDSDDGESSGSYPVISFPDDHTVVSGITLDEMDFDVTRLTLLRDELDELKKRAISEGDDLSKEELIRCLERLQNIQNDVIQEVEAKSLASDVQDSFRRSIGGDSKSTKSSFSSNWSAPLENEQGEGQEVTPKTMRKPLSAPDLSRQTNPASPKVIEERTSPRKISKDVTQEIAKAKTPKASNKQRKLAASADGEAPTVKKKKKRKTKETKDAKETKVKKVKKKRPKNSELAADDDDATPKVKTKKKGVKTKKKQKTKETKEKKRTSKTKKAKSSDKSIDKSIDEGAIIDVDEVDSVEIDIETKYEEAMHSDTDKTPRRRTAKGALSMSSGSSKRQSYLQRLLKSVPGIPTTTSPDETEPVDGEQIESPSAVSKRPSDSSRRSRRTVPVAPETDPNAAKRRTLPRFMSSRNSTPSPGKSPGSLRKKKTLSNPALGIYVHPPTPPSPTPASPPPVSKPKSLHKVPQTPPSKSKSLPKVPETDPTAGKRKKLSRFLNIGGHDDEGSESSGPLRGEKASSRKKDQDSLNATDHAVVDLERSKRKERRGSMGKLFNVIGTSDSSPSTLSSSIRSKKSLLLGKLGKEGDQNMDGTDHAVKETSTRKERRGNNKGRLSDGSNTTTDSPSSMNSKNKSLRAKLASHKEEDTLGATNHAVVDGDRSLRGSLRKHRTSSLGRLFNGLSSTHSQSSSLKVPPPPTEDAEDVASPHAVVDGDRSLRGSFRKHGNSSFGRLFNGLSSTHSQSSSLKVPPPPTEDGEDISSPVDVPRKFATVPQTDPSAAKRSSVGHLFNRRSRSPSRLSTKKPASSSNLEENSDIPKESIASGVSDTDNSSGKQRRSFGNLFNHRGSRSRSPSRLIPTSGSGDVEDVSSPSDFQRQSIGSRVPETDPNAAARRSLGRLFLNGGPPPISTEPIPERRSLRTTRTTMRNSGNSTIPRKSASVRVERTSSTGMDEPSPTGMHLRNRISRPSGSTRSRRTVGGDFDEEPTSQRGSFPSYSNTRGRSASPSSILRSSRYDTTTQSPGQSPGPRPVKGRKAKRPSFVPKTAPVGPKGRVSTFSPKSPNESSQRGRRPSLLVPNLFDSGDEMDGNEDEQKRSNRSHSRQSKYTYLDSSGHMTSVPSEESDDQLDLEYTTNNATGEKGGRKTRRGGRKATLSPSPRQRIRKKNVAEEEPARASVARAKERREHLQSRDSEVPSDPASWRIPRRKKSDAKSNKLGGSKSDIFKDDKEGGTEPTEESHGGEAQSRSSRGMRSIQHLVTRMRKSTDTMDC